MRKTRTVRSLVAAMATSLATPAAGLAVTVASGSVLVGCEDDREPSTHVERLQDPKRRDAAVKRLLQFYEDAMTKDDKDRNGPNVKPLVDMMVPPMVDLYMNGGFTPTTSGGVLSFLSDTRDPRALPALTKAVKDYKMDDKRPEKFDNQMADVVRNLGEMAKQGKLEGNADIKSALFELFTKTQFSFPKAQNQQFYRLLNNTLKVIADPAWESQLIGLIKKPIKSTQKKYAKQTLDQIYWQLTAAELLGELKSKKAVPDLIKMTLTPFKAPAANDALIALIRIGKPSLDAAIKLMKGEDEALMEYSKKEELRFLEDQDKMPSDAKAKAKEEEKAAKAYKNTAVMIVGNIGTLAAVDPMLELAEGDDKELKATIASQLHLLPMEEKIEDEFIKVYDEFAPDAKLDNGDYPKYMLLGVAESFFSDKILNHILDTAFSQKGSKEDKEALYASILEYAVKAANQEQWPTIDKLKDSLSKSKIKNEKYVFKKDKKDKEQSLTDKELVEKIENLEIKPTALAKPDKKDENFVPINELPAFRTAFFNADYIRAVRNGKKVLDECKQDIACYMKKIDSPEATNSETAMIGVKAITMIGMLGKEDVKMKLVDKLNTVRSPGVRAMIQVILLNKSPKGDPAVAKKLKEMMDEAEASRDKKRIDMMKPFKQVIYRLEARKSF